MGSLGGSDRQNLPPRAELAEHCSLRVSTKRAVCKTAFLATVRISALGAPSRQWAVCVTQSRTAFPSLQRPQGRPLQSMSGLAFKTFSSPLPPSHPPVPFPPASLSFLRLDLSSVFLQGDLNVFWSRECYQ